jgi:hypothetical protein
LRRATVHVDVDPAGTLDSRELSRRIAALRSAGHEVVAGDDRHIELLLDGDDPEALRRLAARVCREVFPEPEVTAVCFLSRGTIEDGLGVVRAFGLAPRELRFDGDDEAVVVVSPGALQDAVAAKLRTALEAALNREVTFAESE